MDKKADELVAMFTERLTASLEVAVSAFASELDTMPMLGGRSGIVGAALGKRGKPAKNVGPGGKPQGSCGLCGQPGVKKKTCGKTPEHPGTYGGGRQANAKPAKASKAKDADDDEGEPEPEPALRPAPPPPAPAPPPRVVAPQPAGPKAAPPPRVRRDPGPVSVPDPAERLKDSRDEQIRKLMAKRQGKPAVKEGNAKWNELGDDEEEDERPLTEREVLSDYRAATPD